MKKDSTGFTLIELLVVIAVIGILAAVIMTSMSTARSKGADGGIKKQMLEIRNQAEVYYHNNNSTYTTVCSSGTGNISTMLTKLSTLAAATGGVVTNGDAQTATTVNCYATSSAYAVSVKFKTPTTATYFCIDSTNKALETTTALAANTTTCS
jgi:prepilin-type N-terminal cleavage/methylation domain-containing protein